VGAVSFNESKLSGTAIKRYSCAGKRRAWHTRFKRALGDRFGDWHTRLAVRVTPPQVSSADTPLNGLFCILSANRRKKHFYKRRIEHRFRSFPLRDTASMWNECGLGFHMLFPLRTPVTGTVNALSRERGSFGDAYVRTNLKSCL